MPTKVILHGAAMSPLAVVALSGAIRDVSDHHFVYEGPHSDLLHCNPKITATDGKVTDTDTVCLRLTLPLMESAHLPGYAGLVYTWVDYLNRELGTISKMSVERGDVKLCAADKTMGVRVHEDAGKRVRYALLTPDKWEGWQAVVDACPWILFAQVSSFTQKPLRDAPNLLPLMGRLKDAKSLVRALWHAEAVITYSGYVASLNAAMPGERPMVLATAHSTVDEIIAALEPYREKMAAPFEPEPVYETPRKCKTCGDTGFRGLPRGQAIEKQVGMPSSLPVAPNTRLVVR